MVLVPGMCLTKDPMGDNATGRLGAALLLFLAMLSGAPCGALAGESGLPVPRFASIRAEEVNLRNGPGTSYPVEWVLTRPGWPVEVIAEYEHWRRVRDVDGTVGWVHQTMLSGRRTALVTGGIRTVRAEPAPEADPVLRAEPGVMAELLACIPGWCRVEIAGRRGWIERTAIFGVLEGETFD